MLEKFPISWCSRKLRIVALSTTEAEYIAAAECCKELSYVKSLLSELMNTEVPTTLYVDKQSAIKLIKSGLMNTQSTHIDVRYHYISEKLNENVFHLQYCRSEDQLADIFTKPLVQAKFEKCSSLMMYKRK